MAGQSIGHVALLDEQASRIGNQSGGRVFLFLHTDATVAVFRDLYGNLWNPLQPRPWPRSAA